MQMLSFRPLTPGDSQAVSTMLLLQDKAYLQHFHPFPFDEPTIRTILENCNHDLYWGAFWDDRLIGFFMLRGWDSGYTIPSYGVVVDQAFAGYGVSSTGLEMAKSICKLRGVKQIMLKVYPENLAATRVYERAGFVASRVEAGTGQTIYYYDVPEKNHFPAK